MKEMFYTSNRTCEILYEDYYKDYHFCIVSYGAYPCAYVEIPHCHHYYEKDYTKIHMECHGGLTFSADHLCFVKNSYDGWWIGWDYAHLNDYISIPFSELPIPLYDCKKWSTSEIYEEVKNVVEQLISVDKQYKYYEKKLNEIKKVLIKNNIKNKDNYIYSFDFANENNCELCNTIWKNKESYQEYIDDPYSENVAIVYKNHDHYLYVPIADPYFSDTYLKIEYCPWCGRELHNIKNNDE